MSHPRIISGGEVERIHRLFVQMPGGIIATIDNRGVPLKRNGVWLANKNDWCVPVRVTSVFLTSLVNDGLNLAVKSYDDNNYGIWDLDSPQVFSGTTKECIEKILEWIRDFETDSFVPPE